MKIQDYIGIQKINFKKIIINMFAQIIIHAIVEDIHKCPD